TYPDVLPDSKSGQRTEIVVRVAPGERAGAGILRGPVALRDVEPPKRIYFDLSNPRQADVFMRELHGPLMRQGVDVWWVDGGNGAVDMRSEEHTSELQSRENLVCRLLLEKKK